jgi:hypothetical protein
MNRFSMNTRISRREPGKTPLIDIIFILLIFFLVTMSTNLGSGNTGEGKGEQQSRLPVIENPNRIQGSYLMIDVFDLAEGNGMKRDMIEELRSSFMELSAKLGMERVFQPVPADGFMLSVCGGLRYSDISGFRESSEGLIRKLEEGVSGELIIEKARELFLFYPDFLPAAPRALSQREEEELERKINSMSRLIGGGDSPGIHIRMPEDMYMFFVKSAFRVLERRGVDIGGIRIHAMKV